MIYNLSYNFDNFPCLFLVVFVGWVMVSMIWLFFPVYVFHLGKSSVSVRKIIVFYVKNSFFTSGSSFRAQKWPRRQHIGNTKKHIFNTCVFPSVFWNPFGNTLAFPHPKCVKVETHACFLLFFMVLNGNTCAFPFTWRKHIIQKSKNDDYQCEAGNTFLTHVMFSYFGEANIKRKPSS